MTKSLKSIKDGKQKLETIHRRVKEKKGGLGYLSAIEALEHVGKVKKEETSEEE